MLRLVLLSCLVSGMALGEEAAPGTNVTTSPDEPACRSVPSVTEARGSQASDDGKYFLYFIRLNWHQAMEFCAQIGQRLATFNNIREYNQMVELIRTYNPGDYDAKSNYWTAGSDLGEQDKYVWLTTGKPVTYTNWWSGEPSHGTGNGEMEHCIDLRAEYHYYMNNNQCSRLNYVICEAFH